MFRIWTVWLLWALCCASARAAVLNVEFKYTPFIGDPKQSKEVRSVPGRALVYVNNVPFAEQEVREDTLPVIFEGEIAPSVWLPVASAGSVVRKGKNKIRIEFEPADPNLVYRAQLRWAVVTDETRESQGDDGKTLTNQTDEGVQEVQGKGRSSIEREFVADFVTDQPWHHNPPITSLSDADKAALASLVKARLDTFKPKFEGVYAALKDHPQIRVADVKKHQCIEKAYKAGVRIAGPGKDELVMHLTGGPEVVLRRAQGELFQPADPASFGRIKGDEIQMCAGMALYAAYPPRLMVVRSSSGAWQVVR